MTLWEFDGLFKYTPLFYGWYSSGSSGGYKMPIAYFVTGLVVYGYSFFATLKKMAENSRMSKLSEKDDECIFTWKVFTAWDYMIGNAETAHNRVASIVMGFKEALLEEAEKKKDTETWRIVSFRVLVNVIVIALLTLSMYIVVLVVKRSTEAEAESTFWRKNEIAIVISILTFIFPMIFEVLGIFEQYHPRKQLRLQLGRIMVLNLVNLYSLIFALIDKIGDMTNELQMFKNTTWTECRLDCIDNYDNFPDSDNQIMEVITNMTAQILSNITSTFNESEPEIAFLNNSLINFLSNTINTTADNITYNYEDLDITDLESKFADYLTYLLYSLQDYTNSTPDNIENVTESFTASTNTVPTTYWEEISSTILPLLMNITDRTDEGRFDYDMSTIFNISLTTVTTVRPPTVRPTTSSATISNCTKTCEDLGIENLETGMNYTMKARFRNLCWETMFGQELMSITVMDLIMTIVPSLGMDFFRGIFVRVMNRCWCWDLEKKFPKYGDFKVAENILSLVNNQGMVWMGMFFCPGLVVFNVIKLYITMYFKGWAVMTCNVPPEIIFRASRSNNFYYALLLAMLFLCVLPVGYTIVWIQPSWHCGPFSKYHRIFHIFTNTIRDNVPEPVQRALDYIASPGIVIPLLVLLILIIYYLMSLTNSLREANEDLKIQLRRERTEERRKMFQLADRRRRGGSGESNELSNTPFNKWKKLMGNLPSGKSLDETPRQEDIPKDEKLENKSNDFFSKFIKRALRKSSTSDDADDGTDTEQHDSLPYDTTVAKQTPKTIKSSFSWGNTDFQNVALRAWQVKKSKPETQVHHEETTGDQKHVHINEKPLISGQSHEPSTSKGLRHSFGFNRHINIKDVIHFNSEPFTPITEVSITDIDTNFRESIESETAASKGVRQDSDSSVWSDGIPMITISKTESNENILSVINEPISLEDISTASNATTVFTKHEIEDKTDENDNESDLNVNEESRSHEDVSTPSAKIFKPKIKCVLKKQTTEIDEDTIRYFNDDIEKNISVNDEIRAIVNRDIEDSVSGLSPDEGNTEDVLTDKSSSDTDQKESSADTVLQIPLN